MVFLLFVRRSDNGLRLFVFEEREIGEMNGKGNEKNCPLKRLTRTTNCVLAIHLKEETPPFISALLSSNNDELFGDLLTSRVILYSIQGNNRPLNGVLWPFIIVNSNASTLCVASIQLLNRKSPSPKCHSLNFAILLESTTQ